MIRLDYAPYRVVGLDDIVIQVDDVALEQVGLGTWKNREWVVFIDRTWDQIVSISAGIRYGLWMEKFEQKYD